MPEVSRAGSAQRGLIVVPHFAHRAQPGDPRCPYPPESPEHLAAKAMLAPNLRTKGWVRRVDVEVPIGERRADVWVEKERENRVAIEIQASLIAVEELRAKMLDYRGRGVLALYLVRAAVFGAGSSPVALDGRTVRVPVWVREMEDFSRSAYYGGALFLYLVDRIGVWLALREPIDGTRQQRVHVATELDLADGLLVHRENVLMIAGTDRWFPHRAA
ncbi:MAG TPA: competence protein CoiA family protein [Gemmatimonadales bacterium]|nr:competence protein CoiA family protein [Gemmatimonadales bacterium]